MNCKNCNTEITVNYCPKCGQPAQLKRIDGHYISHEIEHVLHVERGILYTVKELFIRPGSTVRHYIAENRSRLVKPVIFIIITSLVYSLATHFFHLEDGYVQFNEKKLTATGHIFKWIEAHYGYANIIMGVFIAMFTKLFFRKYGYNFFEILILLCFTMGVAMLIIAVFAIIEGIAHIKVMQVAGFLSLAYCTWAIAQFFDKKKAVNYLKAFAAYMLGMLAFAFIAIALGTFIDLFIQH